MSQFPSLLGQSTELQLMIVSYIATSFPTLLALNRTSKQLNAITAEFLYATITLRNDEKSGASVQALSESPHALLVKSIQFEGHIALPPDGYMGANWGQERIRKPAREDLPDSVEDLLGNIARYFSSCATLSVEFPFKQREWEEGFYHFDHEELLEQAKEREDEEAWRNLMVRVYSSVAANPSGSITILTLKRMPSIRASCWDEPPWHNFLAGLQDLSLTLRDADNGAGWCLNTCTGFKAFIWNLDSFFFDHIPNVQTLSFTTVNPVGLNDLQCKAMPWRSSHAPSLKVLKLKEVFIGPQLLDLLRGSADTIEELHLTECHSGLGRPYVGIHDAPSWADLFTCIVSCSPRNLVKVEISPLDVLGTNRVYLREEEKVRLSDIESEIAEGYGGGEEGDCGVGKWDHAFVYSGIDSKYGNLFDDGEKMLQRWEEGEDRTAWRKLMRAVEGNRARREGSCRI
ncbi:hypothetical protein B0J11DRAFT_146415 [Dendryphion nanum]|uniref:F-box domain-containing protein n=1 Tax=Dendryphion nanum TaxID=256645 RepID=A0A9P9IAW8_9PLEO|nr:hypothetical protein B0J11DRAFT_146415 [Dendryphion nanum]